MAVVNCSRTRSVGLQTEVRHQQEKTQEDAPHATTRPCAAAGPEATHHTLSMLKVSGSSECQPRPPRSATHTNSIRANSSGHTHGVRQDIARKDLQEHHRGDGGHKKAAGPTRRDG